MNDAFYFKHENCPQKDNCEKAYRCLFGYFDENFSEEPVIDPYVPLHVCGKGWRCTPERMVDNMINEIRYDVFHSEVDYSLPTVFLAGPTVRGNQTHLTSWRFEAINEFKKQNFSGNLIIPEFMNPTESDQYRYDIPLWEFEGLQRCDCIMFWIPRTKEMIGLTTNHEFGYWMGREREKVVYGRPHDAYRVSYLDVMWVEDWKQRFGSNTGVDIYVSLEKTVKASILKAVARSKA